MTTLNLAEFRKATPEQLRRIVDKSYDEGYQSGLNWKDIWETHRPGGPFHTADSRYPEYSSHSCAEWLAWMNGWADGHAEKHRRRSYNHDDEQHAGGFGDGRL